MSSTISEKYYPQPIFLILAETLAPNNYSSNQSCAAAKPVNRPLAPPPPIANVCLVPFRLYFIRNYLVKYFSQDQKTREWSSDGNSNLYEIRLS